MTRRFSSRLHLILLSTLLPAIVIASPESRAQTPGNEMIDRYFARETALLASRNLADIKTIEDWNARKPVLRKQLAEMLGLSPMPPRTDLQPTVVGRIEHDGYTVERLFFQSMPGLYVTANLYLPKNLTQPAPAILYVCGHSINKKDGVSYGAKAGYTHHGSWFAKNGYVCLMPDTLQLAEIEGIHHGLHRERMWWWQSRGYTPAGVEAWNGIRCLDYLQSRPEVDKEKIGMTGRSGGGAYTWWTAALDDRVKAAVPVAGITDLHNHVVNDVVEGHCDCMYITNTYRWDYATVASLIAPRPLLISNSDKDRIFPLDGVYRIHQQVARIYKLHNAADNLGLLITEGPHLDTQDLQVPAFRWFNRFLKGDKGPLLDASAPKLFTPEQLKVFPSEPPSDQINTLIHDRFVAAAPPPSIPESKEAWDKHRESIMAALKEQTFRGWPASDVPLDLKQAFAKTEQGVHFRAYDFSSQEAIRLRLYIACPANFEGPESVTLSVLDEESFPKWLAGMTDSFSEELQSESAALAALNASADERARAAAPPAPQTIGRPNPATRPASRPATQPAVIAPAAIPNLQAIRSGKMCYAWFAPRGVGLSAWTGTERQLTHIRRRFWLLGQTLEGQQTYDVRRALQAMRSLDEFKELPLHLQSQRAAAALCLYASLFEPNIKSLELHDLPASHQAGPHLLNVLKILDLPTTVALASDRTTVRLHALDTLDWTYPISVSEKLQLPKDRLSITLTPKP